MRFLNLVRFEKGVNLLYPLDKIKKINLNTTQSEQNISCAISQCNWHWKNTNGWKFLLENVSNFVAGEGKACEEWPRRRCAGTLAISIGPAFFHFLEMSRIIVIYCADTLAIGSGPAFFPFFLFHSFLEMLLKIDRRYCSSNFSLFVYWSQSSRVIIWQHNFSLGNRQGTSLVLTHSKLSRHPPRVFHQQLFILEYWG